MMTPSETSEALFFLNKQIVRLMSKQKPVLTKTAYIKNLDHVHTNHPVVEVKYKSKERVVSLAPWLYHYFNFWNAVVASDFALLTALNELGDSDGSQPSGKHDSDTKNAISATGKKKSKPSASSKTRKP